MSEATIVMADGLEEVEALTVVDLLRRADIDLDAAGLNKRDITGSHSIRITADSVFSDKDSGCIILPGGMPGTQNLKDSDLVIKNVQGCVHRGDICAAICAAPTVLAKAGVIKDRSFTCFPAHSGEINEGTFINDQDVVVDGNIVTSRGVGTAIPFALELIRLLRNKETSEEVKNKILFDK